MNVAYFLVYQPIKNEIDFSLLSSQFKINIRIIWELSLPHLLIPPKDKYCTNSSQSRGQPGSVRPLSNHLWESSWPDIIYVRKDDVQQNSKQVLQYTQCSFSSLAPSSLLYNSNNVSYVQPEIIYYNYYQTGFVRLESRKSPLLTTSQLSNSGFSSKNSQLRSEK